MRLDNRRGDVDFIPLNLNQNDSPVFTHSDPSVDIAVVPTAPSLSTFDYEFLSSDMLSTLDTFAQYDIGEGSSIFFTGLFATYYGEHRNIPITRFGHMAMFPDEVVPWNVYPGRPPQQARIYLIEIQSYGGNSGSPVFFSIGTSDEHIPNTALLLAKAKPTIRLAGVMSGRFNSNEPLAFAQSPTAVIPYSTPNIGIAAVTPSYLLYEILFSDRLKKFRADHPITQ